MRWEEADGVGQDVGGFCESARLVGANPALGATNLAGSG